METALMADEERARSDVMRIRTTVSRSNRT